MLVSSFIIFKENAEIVVKKINILSEPGHLFYDMKIDYNISCKCP